MSRSIRKQLIDSADQALDRIVALDEILYNMEAMSEGRQPLITEITPLLVKGHNALYQLWKSLRDQL